MPFDSGYSQREAQLTMTLSELAYSGETPLPNETIAQQEQRIGAGITAGLGGAGYAAWAVAWGPTLSSDRGNLMYAARNTATNQYAISVRGTDWTFMLNWIEDFGSLLGQVPYAVTPNSPTIRIAAGTAAGLAVLQGMNANASNTTLQQFLRTIGGNADVFVTGHSLGGCLASALAPVVANTLGDAGRVKVYTFAAPAAGNQAFASYYNQLFRDAADPGRSSAFRIYDTLDAVPNAWASLGVIDTYYQGFVAAPQDIRDVIEFGQSVVGNGYAQVGAAGDNSAFPLAGQIIQPFQANAAAGIDPIGDALFLYQAAEQHSGLNYLSLLGVNRPVSAGVANLKRTVAGIKRSRAATA